MSPPPTPDDPSSIVASWRSGFVLALAVILAVGGLQIIERMTRDRIEDRQAGRRAATLAEVLPDVHFDKDPLDDVLPVDTEMTGSPRVTTVHRLQRGDTPVGAVLGVVTTEGYSGAIELLVGMDADRRVTAVRVIEHRETPGLGDRIEHRRSNWIRQFEGRALDTPGGWRVFRGRRTGDAGDAADVADAGYAGYAGYAESRSHDNTHGPVAGFDALTGATITSRAVIDAVRHALSWTARHPADLLGDE